MDLNIESYLKIYPAFSKEFCEETVDQLKSQNWIEHSYTVAKEGYNEVSYDNEFSVCHAEIENKQKIMNGIWNSYLKYIKDINFSWFSSWSGHSAVRFNKYDENTLMIEHCDHIHSIFEGDRRGVPTMTALGTLNEDYEGGDLIFFQDKKIFIPSGHIAIFPSNFLYPHYVSKITKGVRFSYVSWAW